MEAWKLILFVWFAGFIVKFCLMVSSSHISAGVQKRVFARYDVHGTFWHWYWRSLLSTLVLSLFLWPMALYTERLRFFKAYRRVEVIRDTVRSCYQACG